MGYNTSRKKKIPSKRDATKQALDRLARIEGQIRGLRAMIEEKNDCLDVITQVSAIREAVNMLGVQLLRDDLVCKFDGAKKLDEAYLRTIFKMK